MKLMILQNEEFFSPNLEFGIIQRVKFRSALILMFFHMIVCLHSVDKDEPSSKRLRAGSTMGSQGSVSFDKGAADTIDNTVFLEEVGDCHIVIIIMQNKPPPPPPPPPPRGL